MSHVTTMRAASRARGIAAVHAALIGLACGSPDRGGGSEGRGREPGAEGSLGADAQRPGSGRDGAAGSGGLRAGPMRPAFASGGVSLNEALATRRSVRDPSGRDLTIEEVGQILWAGQGVTSPDGRRTAPSAGATYPLELRVIATEGVFGYDPAGHALERLAPDDRRRQLADAALGQSWVGAAAADFVVAGVVDRTSWKYGERAGRYVAMEAGAASQNMLLEAAALGLGAVLVGAFDDDEVREIAALPDGATPFAIVSVGSRK